MADAQTLEIKKRRKEKIYVAFVLGFLALFSYIELFFLDVSYRLPFVDSLFFFGLMNLNLILIMLLLFLIFRNVIKTILDRKKIGSHLKKKLVVCFLLFALIPTVFLFLISSFYIKSSFDKWFSFKIERTLEKSIDIINSYYQDFQRNGMRALDFISKKIDLVPGGDLKKIQWILNFSRKEYGLESVWLYTDPLLPPLVSYEKRTTNDNQNKMEFFPLPIALDLLQRAFIENNNETKFCSLQNIGYGELIRCFNKIYVHKNKLWVLVTDGFIKFGLADSLSRIQLTYNDYKQSNPLQYPVKNTYFAILIMVTLLIVFSALWTGIYIAKIITIPIDKLSLGTVQISKGNFEYSIPTHGPYQSNDELWRLIHSFNTMIRQLRQSKIEKEEHHVILNRINEELSHKQKTLEVVIENLHTGVIVLDEKDYLTHINKEALKMLHFVCDENSFGKIQGRQIFPEEARRTFDTYIERVKTSQKEKSTQEVRFQFQGFLPASQFVCTLRSLKKDDKYIGTVVVVEDLTELQKMERMTAWKEVAKRITHEIKNPLTPIQLSVERLRRRYLHVIEDDGTFHQATSIILNEVHALKNLVSEFGIFSRLPEMEKKKDSILAIVYETFMLYKNAHENINFQFKVQDGFCDDNLFWDRAQIRRAFINILDNAVGAIEEHRTDGSIIVSLAFSQRKTLEIIIEDNGIGLSKEALTQLFMPYFSTKSQGTGLGLAITERIISDHGGKIRAERREASLGGSRFIIEFIVDFLVRPFSLYQKEAQNFFSQDNELAIDSDIKKQTTNQEQDVREV